MKTPRRHDAGITLTEMVIVLAIVSTLFTLGAMALTQMVRSIRLNAAKAEVLRDTRAAVVLIARELRQAQPATVVIDQLPGEPPFSRITFSRLAANGQPAGPVSYFQSAGRLWTQRGAAGRVPVAGGLTAVAFGYPNSADPRTVALSMTFAKATYQGNLKVIHAAQEQIRIMNP